MIYKNVMRGADPEVFLQLVADKSPQTSIGLIGGTKEAPRYIDDGFAVQEDNVAVEFNIPPSKSRKDFVENIQRMLSYLSTEVGGKGLELLIEPSCIFSEIDLMHPQAQHLGCEPDYNAWTMEINPRPRPHRTMRSAGGHLHLSWDEPNVDDASLLVKAHDLFCGVPSLLYDKDTQRRSKYGKAGACRFKSYGVEYRTPSNFWLRNTEMIEWFYEQSEKAVNFLNNGGKILEEDSKIIQTAINKSDLSYLDSLNSSYGIL